MMDYRSKGFRVLSVALMSSGFYRTATKVHHAECGTAVQDPDRWSLSERRHHAECLERRRSAWVNSWRCDDATIVHYRPPDVRPESSMMDYRNAAPAMDSPLR